MPRSTTRKRPCKVCRRWFLPDVRHRDRQKTCGPECRKEWHKRQCASWNKRNKEYFKANYLQKKLDEVRHSSKKSPETSGKPPPNRVSLDLPWDVIQDVIGLEAAVIVGYIIEQIIRGRQAPIKGCPRGEDSGSPNGFSRRFNNITC